MPAAQQPTRDSSLPNIRLIAFDGAAAGAQTVTGVAIGDRVIDVVAWPDAGGVPSNVGSEFTSPATVANTLDNTGGTSLAGKVGLALIWVQPTQLK